MKETTETTIEKTELTESEEAIATPVILDAIDLAISALPADLHDRLRADLAIARENGPATRDAHLSEAERRLVALDRLAPAIKAYYEARREALENVVAERGVGHYFQDADGIVYKTAEAEGRFVYFDRYEVKRTRREGERAGTLSMSEATTAGFRPNGHLTGSISAELGKMRDPSKSAGAPASEAK